jgi:hypothetical protein
MGIVSANVPKNDECVAIYVLCNICANPPNAPTMFSMSWKVAAVLWLKDCVRLAGLFGSPGMPIPPPYMPPIPMPMPMPPPYMPPIPPMPPMPPYMEP